MKVGLIKPPSILRNYRFINSQPPINLAMLGAYLQERGVEVQIRDFDVQPLDDLEPWLAAFRPDLVGLTAMTPMILAAAAIAQRIKDRSGGIPIVVGGPHASALPERTLREFPAFDFAIAGEGEEPLMRLVEGLKGASLDGIPGLSRREGGAIVAGPPPRRFQDLDSLPLPDRGLLPLDRYQGQSFRGFARRSLRIAELVTSRGCPYACIFCHAQDRKVRMLSAARVLEDLQVCRHRHGAQHIVFMDDMFTLNRRRLAPLLAGLRDLGLTFNCSTRVDAVDPDLLREMARSGCRGVSFGVESGSPRVLEWIGKQITVEQSIRAFDAARAAGIPQIEASIVLGAHPDEEAVDIQQTIALLRRLRPTIISVTTVVPYPGTPLYQLMIDRGLLSPDAGWDQFVFFGGRPSWRTQHFTIAELAKVQNRILREHFFSWRFLRHLLRTVRGVGDVRYYLDSAAGFLRSSLPDQRPPSGGGAGSTLKPPAREGM
jgi:radical SAM superfamily enzyme YgiQ (UPF0313 family)